MPSPQYRYWMLTIPEHSYQPPTSLPEGITYLKGQKEIGESGYRHWQLVVALSKAATLGKAKSFFTNDSHIEPTKSAAANDYVHKDESSVTGTRFELGALPMKRNSKTDWDKQFALAKEGKFNEMDTGVLIKHYNNLKRIRTDYMVPPKELSDVCGLWFVGPPGVGKSYTARAAFPGIVEKAINKWFDGYGETTAPILLDDFDHCHKVLGHYLKRWGDRYPFTAEVKGGSIKIRPFKVVVTSNYTIGEIFSEDATLVQALGRRFEIVNFI